MADWNGSSDINLSRLGLLPTSINQERILAAREIRTDTATTPPSLIRLGLKLRGSVDGDLVKGAIEELVRRHDALRTTFARNVLISPPHRASLLKRFARSGIPELGLFVQSADRMATVPFTSRDLRALDEAGQNAAVGALINTEIWCHFENEDSPRIRSFFLRLKDDEHLLILIVDHMVCDGFSAAIILRDVESALRSTTGERTEKMPPAGSFLDFCAWQHEATRTTHFNPSILFWRDQWAQYCSARIAVQELPFSVLGEARNPFDFSTIHERLIESIAQEIRLFATRSKSTLFTVFLTALAVVLGCYTAKTSVAIWSHFANRAQRRTNQTVGWFNNSHILGIDLSDNPSGMVLLRRAQGVIQAAFINQELPLPYFWSRLGCMPRIHDVSILLDYRTSKSIARFESRQMEVTRAVLPDSNGPRFSPLGVYVSDDEELRLTCKYSSERFRSEGVRKLLTDVTQVAVQLSRTPHAVISLYGSQCNISTRQMPEDHGMGEFVLRRQALLSALPIL